MPIEYIEQGERLMLSHINVQSVMTTGLENLLEQKRHKLERIIWINNERYGQHRSHKVTHISHWLFQEQFTIGRDCLTLITALENKVERHHTDSFVFKL